jgi:hypothetical protein
MSWFAVQVDRDFINGKYGEGYPRLYFTKNTDKYYLIESGEIIDNKLNVKTKCGKTFILDSEPNNTVFVNSIYANWKLADESFLKYDEDRCGYEPWAYDSLKSLKIELKLLKEHDITLFYKKPTLS